MMFESPGSIRNQVGRSLSTIRVCVEREDIVGLVNHTRFLVVLASPYLIEKERDELAVEVDDDRDEDKIFESCMRRIEKLLAILGRHGIYAYAPPEVTDATDLALTDGPPPSEEATA